MRTSSGRFLSVGHSEGLSSGVTSMSCWRVEVVWVVLSIARGELRLDCGVRGRQFSAPPRWIRTIECICTAARMSTGKTRHVAHFRPFLQLASPLIDPINKKCLQGDSLRGEEST